MAPEMSVRSVPLVVWPRGIPPSYVKKESHGWIRGGYDAANSVTRSAVQVTIHLQKMSTSLRGAPLFAPHEVIGR
jgi:hypothetical protein